MRTKDAFYSQLVSKERLNYPVWDSLQTNRADCLSYGFITPGDASKSLVVAVLDPSASPGTVKSHLTPPQSLSISAKSLESLKTWINNGAAQ